jgi:hypothetical protein
MNRTLQDDSNAGRKRLIKLKVYKSMMSQTFKTQGPILKVDLLYEECASYVCNSN